MRNAIAQQLPLGDPDTQSVLPVSASLTSAPAPAALPSADDGGDGLPPPTKAQVFHWAQLCGELTLRGTAGIADADGWSADLAPTAATLKALQERGLVARRDRAWKLRRGWYGRLTALKARAVDTPVLGVAERPAPNLPTYAELERWEAVCRWLDAQPARRARLPFAGLASVLADGEASADAMDGHTYRPVDVLDSLDSLANSGGSGAVGQAVRGLLMELRRVTLPCERERAVRVATEAVGGHAALLKAMRRYRLVRHTQGCEWALSPKWREKLRDLHAGINRALREYGSPRLASAAARSLCAGLDTWGLNWLVEDDENGGVLPARLHRQLEDYQELARAQEGEVETAWVYDGVPLRMYQAGVRAKGGSGDGKQRSKAKGVSWSFILVNPSLRLLIRRVPLGGIVANARLGSECLWRRTPRAAMVELHALIRRLWGKQRGRWQVSYAHLAHDVANAPLEREHLDRYVSRSRRQAVYDAAQADLRRLLREARPHGVAGAMLDGVDGLDGWEWDVDGEWGGPLVEDIFYDWEAEFGENEKMPMMDGFDDEDGWDRVPWAVQRAKAELDGAAKERAISAYQWGQRLSGVAFSPGGAVSFVMYRKDWEGRLKQKRHMEPIWKAAGWDGKEPVTRHEARLVREPIRELCLAGSARPVLDDPSEFLEHLDEVWARMVGRADVCPEVVDVAWLRRVIQREGESNRSRWDTDPIWRVVQAAPFAPAPLAPRRLIRRHQQRHDVRMVDRGLLGLFKRREALLHADPSGRDLSLAMRDAVVGLERELVARGEQFDEAVRRKRQNCGLPVPLAGQVLPMWPRWAAEETDALRTFVEELERDLERPGHEAAPGTGKEAERGEVGPDAAESGTGALWSGEGSVLRPRDTGPRERIVTYASLRTRSAELRMREAYAALETAELAGARPIELERLEHAFLQATAAYDAARSLSSLVAVGTLAPGEGSRRSLPGIPRS